MAFLCPSGLGRSKQRREIHSSILERLNGFDPLVKFEVGRLNANNPEALRIVLHNFTACRPEELTVRQGQKVHILFREGDWAYVVAADKKEGFIPFTACAKIVAAPCKKGTKTSVSPECNHNEHKQADRINNNTYNVKKNKSLSIQQLHNNILDDTFSGDYIDDSFLSTDWSNDSPRHQAAIDELKTKCVSQSNNRYDDNKNLIQAYFDSNPYEKLPHFLEIFDSLPNEDTRSKRSEDGKTPGPELNETTFSETSIEIPNDTYITLFDFSGRHIDDIDVARDDLVVVLNKTDPFWYWVRKKDGQEGYVPSNYIGQINDPRVVEILTDRQKRTTSDSQPGTHHFHCKCEECMPVSPRSDTTNVSSSTFGTKKRPPKPPRTRVKPQKESKHSKREKSASGGEQIVPEKSVHTPSWKKRTTLKPSAHHLSLENLPVAEAKQNSCDKSSLTSPSSNETNHSGKKRSRRRGSNYREYRSQSQRSYTYEESKDYFDAYFYDEPDSGYKSSKHDQDNVVNVTEILKQRNVSTKGTNNTVKDGISKQRNQWMKNGSNDKGHNILNLRQYMHSLPSTTIGGQLNAELEKALDKNMTDGSKIKEGSSDKKSRKQNNLDWSFGYPRKTKSNSNSRSSSAHFIHKDSEQKPPKCNNCVNRNVKGNVKSVGSLKGNVKSVGSQTDLRDIGIDTPDPSDRMFLELLSATDNLLDVSAKFLSNSKAETNITEYIDNKGDRRSSSSETDEDVNEKCNHFLTNHVIGTEFGQPTDRTKTSETFTSDISEANISEIQANATNANNKDPTEIPEITAVITIEESGTNVEEIEGNEFKSINRNKEIHDYNSDHNISYTEHVSCITVSNNSSANKSHISTVNQCDLSSRKSSENSETDGNFGANCLDVRGVTEFVVQYDYEPESDMAIPIIKNEILHISLDIQEDENWYWAFSPRLRTYGYVPKLYVKIPLVTII